MTPPVAFPQGSGGKILFTPNADGTADLHFPLGGDGSLFNLQVADEAGVTIQYEIMLSPVAVRTPGEPEGHAG